MARVTDAAQSPEPTVLARVSGRVGHLTLNRPRAINALDIDMIERLTDALVTWRNDPAVAVVMLDGAGDRGLCAGGDIRKLYEQVAGGDPAGAAAFFRDEYALNAAIGDYAKPIVAIADGITMGGGIGLAGHAALRVVTERSRLAMPETRIGFSPDVGGTWLLGGAPGRVGEYLGLTGTTMDAADALYAGFADVHVPVDALDALREDLEAGTDPADAVRGHATQPGRSKLDGARGWIDDAFSADTVPEILVRLRARPEPEASAAAGTLGELSPTAMAVTLEGIRRARTLADLRAALVQEYGLVMWFVLTQPDLPEGIRAQVVDKDRSPRWSPATPDEVSADALAAAFSFVPPAPLWG